MHLVEETPRGSFSALLVGDAPHVAEMNATLVPSGIEVVSAGTAASVQSLLETVSIDVVLLLDGKAQPDSVVRATRCAEGRRYIPVIKFLNTNDSAERMHALQAGCDDVVVAPFTQHEVVLRVLRASGMHRRIDALLSRSARLERLALVDSLTQVANRRHFDARLNEEFARATRRDEPLSLILVDLDHFKHINDTHGHPVGDAVLQRVARLLGNCVRETDFVARFGGEEFAALLPQTTAFGGRLVAERIREELQHGRPSDANPVVTASFGVAAFPLADVRTPAQLVHTADLALYRAKREGRNRVVSVTHAPRPGLFLQSA
ncbi:MAG: diguanylate cyclase [Myxococcaceae bacterium]|nr:diguanylate cyclase [Myxococcaceae bacterium]